MNRGAIDVALSFLSVRDFIVLQCPTARDIPYVKRVISEVLGVPDFIVGDNWHYGRKTIKMMSCSARPMNEGYPYDSLFYIGWASGKDVQKALEEGVDYDNYPLSLGVWWKAGMTLYDMYHSLQVDGYNELDVARYLVEYFNDKGGYNHVR